MGAEKRGWGMNVKELAENLGFEKDEYLILTDILMPHMSGPQLIKQLKQVRQDFKVLYMTEYADEAIVQHGVVDKTINLIHKPFTIEKLARKVREVLDKK
jgi:DNA-binding NtrC family response regulator